MTDRYSAANSEGNQFTGRVHPSSGRPLAQSIGLSQKDLARVQEQFGVGADQVRRDHLISHLLGALSTMPEREDLIFFGGTALSRTLLTNSRLSEDIDLITTGNRTQMASAITEAFESGLSRSHGTIEWLAPLIRTKGAEPAVLQVDGPIRVQIQLLSSVGYPDWPTEIADLEQRYSDAPRANLRVLTPAAFAAAKMLAWQGRQTPRDLYDLCALSREGHIGAEAAALYRQWGPTGNNPAPYLFTEAPTDSQWQKALGHQTIVEIGPKVALEEVRVAWSEATSG